MQRRDSEVEAYKFILDKLDDLGWDTRDPEKHADGQVYTQNQILQHPEFKKQLGQDRPENVVKLTESKYWVIEAKSDRGELDTAVDEAINQYAAQVNDSNKIEVVLITGLAGNDADKYKVESHYREDGEFRPVEINGEEPTNLLSPEIVQQLLESDSAEIENIPVDENYFLKKAETINQILHDGAIHKDRRAKVIAALLLALSESEPDLDASPKVLINDINNRVSAVLDRENKSNLKDQIEIELPSSDNQKFKTAIVRTVRELKDLNIKSAMDSSTDVLGKFYEVFLKYGNGAKDIGIVLTPRHITEFAAQILDIDYKDVVYDPTCGTGGFLVASLDKIRSEADEAKSEEFRKNRLFGIEQEPTILALAIVNMIFRGDGKTNIREANCFNYHLNSETIDGVASAEFTSDEEFSPAATKILMNPPFGLDNEDEKSYRFIEHVLDDMEDGGILFSVVMYSTLVKGGAAKKWRKRLLEDHTVLSVMTLPEDLFYPVGVHTAAIVIKKGESHPDDQNILWARPINDGKKKSKGKRLEQEDIPDDFEELENTAKAFIHSPGLNVPDKERFQTATPYDSDDSHIELAPEEYVPSASVSQDEDVERVDRYLELLIGNLMLYISDFDSSIFRRSFDADASTPQLPDGDTVEYKQFELTDLFKIQSGDYHVATDLDDGEYPLISCPEDRNGITKPHSELIYCDVPEDNLYSDKITVAYNGQPLTAKFHPYKFASKDDVAVLHSKDDVELSTAVKIYISNAIERNKWRYNYGRKCYKAKMNDRTVILPIDEDDNPDLDYMEAVVKLSPYWPVLKEYMANRDIEQNSDESPEKNHTEESEGTVSKITEYQE